MENLLLFMRLAVIHAPQTRLFRERFPKRLRFRERSFFYADFTENLCVSLLKSCMVSATIKAGL
jgi:hypothetical protein